MTVPFMRAYTELLVKTCHAPRRARDGRDGGGDPVAHRRGGQQARFEAVRADKEREAGDGFDGTWVAHPDSVAGRDGGVRRRARRPAEPGRQAARRRVGRAAELLDVAATPGEITEEGLRSNVNVGIQYISSWLRGNGAAGDLRPDGGRRHGRDLTRPGVAVDPPRREARRRPPDHARAGARAGDEELEKIRAEIGDDEWFEQRGPARPVARAVRAGGARATSSSSSSRCRRTRAAAARAWRSPARPPRSRFGAALGLAQLAQGSLALVAGGAVQDQHAVEVVDLVLDHARLEAGGLDQAVLALLVARRARARGRALDVDGDAGDREAALLEVSSARRSTTRSRG